MLVERILPGALEDLSEIRRAVGRRTPAFFLDLDGTLAPLAPHPDMARVPSGTRKILGSLARDHVVCVVSGRGLVDLRRRVDLNTIFYAADHGYRILGPDGSGVELEVGPEDRQQLEAASYELERRLRYITGVLIETKGVSVAIHYRLVPENVRPQVKKVVDEVAEAYPELRLTAGKLVHEFMPVFRWNKGQAMLWLLKRLRLGRRDVCPICMGDDLTDENMFIAAGDWGVTVAVGESLAETCARWRLEDSRAAAVFLEAFTLRSG